jgi:hypothetical protein
MSLNVSDVLINQCRIKVWFPQRKSSGDFDLDPGSNCSDPEAESPYLLHGEVNTGQLEVRSAYLAEAGSIVLVAPGRHSLVPGQPISNNVRMNENTTNQWNEVGSLLNGLGLKLKLHAEQAAGEEKAIASDALRSLGDSLENAFEALQSAAKDPAVKEDIRNVAQTLSGAVSSTLSGLGSDLRESVGRAKE